jgi:hypothetical protein
MLLSMLLDLKEDTTNGDKPKKTWTVFKNGMPIGTVEASNMENARMEALSDWHWTNADTLTVAEI